MEGEKNKNWKKIKKSILVCIGIVGLVWLILYLLMNTSWAQREIAAREIKRVFQIDIKDIEFYYENNLKILGIGKNGTLMVKFTANSKIIEEMIPNYTKRWEDEEILSDQEKEMIRRIFNIEEEINGKIDFYCSNILYLHDNGDDTVTLYLYYYEYTSG